MRYNIFLNLNLRSSNPPYARVYAIRHIVYSFMLGIDECWPSGSRCAEGLWCHDALLGYTCSDSQYNMLGVHGSHTSVVSLLTDIRDGLYKIVSIKN